MHGFRPTQPFLIIIFTNPSAQAGYDTWSIFNAEFNRFWIQSFPSPRLVASHKAEEPSLPYYLPIAGGRIIGFIPFPRVLVLCEMLSVRSRIWTRVSVSISCDDNHYTTNTSFPYYRGSFNPSEISLTVWSLYSEMFLIASLKNEKNFSVLLSLIAFCLKKYIWSNRRSNS